MHSRANAWFAGMLLAGLLLVLYPSIGNWFTNARGQKIAEYIQETLRNVDTESQRELAQQYNIQLRDTPPIPSEDMYNSILNIHDGIMGIIRIPKIHVELPIYHGVSEDSLRKGIGHISQSAFPIGGEGNHAVLAGHTGLPSAELLSHLSDVIVGDLFIISILGEELTYQVDQIKVVAPDDTQDLLPISGKDYCTLVTCTPYGINSHRLLVRGARIEE